MSVEHIVKSTREEWLAERRHDVTASDVAALYGVHHFKTVYGLSREKRGLSDLSEEETAWMERGRELESIVLAKFAARHPTWRVWPAEEYLRDPEVHLGATPDAYAEDHEKKFAVVEIKVVSSFEFKRRWSEASPPEAILLQVITQLALSDASYGLVVPFDVDRWVLREAYRVDRFPELEADIHARAKQFMADVAAGQEPNPDFTRDGAMLAARYLNGAPGKKIDLRHDNHVGELCQQYVDCKLALKALTKQRETLAAELQSKLEDAEIALVSGFDVTNKLVERRAYQVAASKYRRLSVTREDDEEESE